MRPSSTFSGFSPGIYQEAEGQLEGRSTVRRVVVALLALISIWAISPLRASADTLTIPYTFTPNTTAQSGQVNSNFTNVKDLINGNITNSNIKAAAAIALSKLALTATALDLMATGNNTWASGITADTVPRVTLRSEGGIMMGAGG